MKKLILGLVLALALVLSTGIPVLAADYADVTVTADPTYLAITNTPNTWDMGGKVLVDTTYYSNPLGATTPPSATVLDAECRFTVSCTAGSDTVDLSVNVGDFAGGGAAMTNSNDGSNGAATFGSYSWYSGMTYANKVLAKSTGSAELYSTGLAAEASLKWGIEIETRTTAWTSGESATSTVTITATAH